MNQTTFIPGLADDLAPTTYDLAKDFALHAIRPHAALWDKAEKFPIGLFREAGMAGLLGC